MGWQQWEQKAHAGYHMTCILNKLKNGSWSMMDSPWTMALKDNTRRGEKEEIYNCKRAFHALRKTCRAFKHRRRPQLKRTELKAGEVHAHIHRLKQACLWWRLAINRQFIGGSLWHAQPKAEKKWEEKQHRPNRSVQLNLTANKETLVCVWAKVKSRNLHRANTKRITTWMLLP